MPHYEFFCRDCKKFFDKILCPHCGTKDVEQRWSAFPPITSKKSA
jgi:RNA polymerase subunit RPABC4/transcription elongation factor Spt4